MKKIFVIIALSLFLGVPLIVSAADTGGTPDTQPKKTTVPCPGGKGQCVPLTNPLGASKQGTIDVTVLIGTIIKAALGIIGSLTLLMLVWGGFQWLTSAGNPERIKKGTQTMVWAVIGLVLVMASYMILTTYLDYLTGVK